MGSAVCAHEDYIFRVGCVSCTAEARERKPRAAEFVGVPESRGRGEPHVRVRMRQNEKPLYVQRPEVQKKSLTRRAGAEKQQQGQLQATLQADGKRETWKTP